MWYFKALRYRLKRISKHIKLPSKVLHKIFIYFYDNIILCRTFDANFRCRKHGHVCPLWLWGGRTSRWKCIWQGVRTTRHRLALTTALRALPEIPHSKFIKSHPPKTYFDDTIVVLICESSVILWEGGTLNFVLTFIVGFYGIIMCEWVQTSWIPFQKYDSYEKT